MSDLPYHETITDLRRDLVAASLEFDRLATENRAAEGPAYLASLIASSGQYVIAALLGHLEREWPDGARDAAAIVDCLLTNGDFDDLNGDVEVSA